MPEKNNNHITLEDLAAMVNKGFTETQKHIDQRIDKVESLQKDMLEELTATHEDVRYVRSTTDALVRSDIAQDATIHDLTARVHRLEQKAGLAR